MKDFFENPALLVGAPLLVLGLIGLGIAALALLAPQPATATGPRHVGHPGPAEYVRIGIILASITAVEVLIYYFNIPKAPFVMILLVLSLSKFVLVLMFFMHLKFDSRLFSTAFVTGLLLAISVFIVVLATLGGNLV
ncbi:MAG: cytochrome C oxidase subunit IV family protein [Chloroflexi bacterium]|nr:cytochrome C oxidase subunit IV family protein [Chloroflexota bacterium]